MLFSSAKWVFSIACALISALMDLIGYPVTFYVLKKQISRRLLPWYAGSAQVRGGGANWMYRMISFSVSLLVTPNTWLNRKIPTFLGCTSEFEQTFGNKTWFQESAWNRVFAVSFGLTYGLAFIQFWLIMSFLTSRLRIDQFDVMARTKRDIVMVAIGFAGSAVMVLLLAVYPVYFEKLDDGVYALRTESPYILDVVFSLLSVLFLILLAGPIVIWRTWGKLVNLDVVANGELSQTAKQQNKLRRDHFKKSTAIIVSALVLGAANTFAIRLSIEIPELHFLFVYFSAFLMITSSYICFALLGSLYVIHKQTRDDAQATFTRSLRSEDHSAIQVSNARSATAQMTPPTMNNSRA